MIYARLLCFDDYLQMSYYCLLCYLILLFRLCLLRCRYRVLLILLNVMLMLTCVLLLVKNLNFYY